MMHKKLYVSYNVIYKENPVKMKSRLQSLTRRTRASENSTVEIIIRLGLIVHERFERVLGTFVGVYLSVTQFNLNDVQNSLGIIIKNRK